MVVRLGLIRVVRSHGAWLVDASGLRDKRFDMRWCTVGCLGQHKVVPVGLSCWLATLVVVGCVGVVLCENCIVDASIFLFCVLVFVP